MISTTRRTSIGEADGGAPATRGVGRAGGGHHRTPRAAQRAPTLHRLGIQAFEPQLIEGKAIQIHPLVCTAFNADFDGDQMAVHLPLSAEAQAEARILMLSTNNILKPADGRPVTGPTQDMIIGIYYLTMLNDNEIGEGRAFGSVAEALMAFDRGELSVQAKIKLRLRDIVPPPGRELNANGTIMLETTLGRALFNEALPDDYPYADYEVGRSSWAKSSTILPSATPRSTSPAAWISSRTSAATGPRSGVTVSIGDVSPADKAVILAGYEDRAGKIDRQYERGLITEDERRQELIEIWTDATSRLGTAMEQNFDRNNPIYMMVHSGCAGTWCRCARSPPCEVWWSTRRARSSRGRSSPTSAKA